MALLLDASGTLTPSCEKAHVSYALFLRERVSHLVIDFSYAPKRAEDNASVRERKAREALRYFPGGDEAAARELLQGMTLTNLLTLSVDDENGCRGAAHRHAPEQRLWIGSREASPGFTPGPLPKGRLVLTLSIHAVASETCSYSLIVRTEEET